MKLAIEQRSLAMLGGKNHMQYRASERSEILSSVFLMDSYETK